MGRAASLSWRAPEPATPPPSRHPVHLFPISGESAALHIMLCLRYLYGDADHAPSDHSRFQNANICELFAVYLQQFPRETENWLIGPNCARPTAAIHKLIAGLHRSTAKAGPGNGCAGIPTIAAPGEPSHKPVRHRSSFRRTVPIRIGGCSFAEDPTHSAQDAAILFDAATDAWVLPCEIVDGNADRVDLLHTGCFSALLHGEDPCEHVLLSDGIRRVRLDVHGGSLREGPVALRFCFTGLARIGAPLTTLRRLAAFERLGRMPRYLFPAERRADRWTLALRAHDARAHGASQREVAEALFGVAPVRRDWDAASDHLRSRIRRLLRLGAGMTAGGWRTLLAPASTGAAAAKDGEEKTGAPREG